MENTKDFCLCLYCIEYLNFKAGSKIPSQEYIKICAYHAHDMVYTCSISDPINTILNFLERYQFIVTHDTLEEKKAKPSKHLIYEDLNFYCIDKHQVGSLFK